MDVTSLDYDELVQTYANALRTGKNCAERQKKERNLQRVAECGNELRQRGISLLDIIESLGRFNGKDSC